MTEIAAEPEFDQAALSALGESFRGQLVRRSESDYDEQRKIWNGSIDRRPALIACCAGVADVIAAARFARESGLEVALRSGGHSYPGLSVCDGGMVIDMGSMGGLGSIPGDGRRGLRPVFCSASSTGRRRRSGSRFRRGSSPTLGLPGSRSVGGLAGLSASTG